MSPFFPLPFFPPPLRANLVPRAEAWPWSSLARRVEARGLDLLDEGPVLQPLDWREQVNAVETAGELAALRRSVLRGTPFGAVAWQQATAARLGLQSTLKPLGRPRKSEPATESSTSLFDTFSHRSDPQ